MTDNYNATTENILLSFIILIIAIGVGYWLNTRRNGLEGFDGGAPPPQNTDPFPLPPNPYPNSESVVSIPSTTAAATMPQGTIPLITPPVSTTVDLNTPLPKEVTQQLDTITDTKLKNALEQQFRNIQATLARYSTLDTPIIMNDSGQICNMWGNYAGGKYSPNQNECVSIDNSGLLQCLDNSSTPSRCTKLLEDGYINNRNTIDYKLLLKPIINSVIQKIPVTNANIEDMNKNADTIINSYVDRSFIQSHQQEIINNNNQNIDDKRKIIDSGKEELSKKQNETNINQNNFSLFRTQISDSDSTSNLYYKIIIGLIICILIIGIFNFLFSNILS